MSSSSPLALRVVLLFSGRCGSGSLKSSVPRCGCWLKLGNDGSVGRLVAGAVDGVDAAGAGAGAVDDAAGVVVALLVDDSATGGEFSTGKLVEGRAVAGEEVEDTGGGAVFAVGAVELEEL
jgi:hypothetical protein